MYFNFYLNFSKTKYMKSLSLKRIFYLFLLPLIFFQSCKKKEVNNLPQDTIIPISKIPIVVPVVSLYNNPYEYVGKLKLKGIMHVHTDHSLPLDGYKSGNPTWVAQKIRDEGGYDFYTFTDHNYITEDPKVGGIVWMGNAVEDTSPSVHVTAYNLPTTVFNSTPNDISAKINHYKDLGAYTSLCHPNWPSTFITEAMINNATIGNFVEVMNPTTNVENHRILDLIRQQNKIVFGFGVDDFHNDAKWSEPNKFFNKGWVVAYADVKEKDDIWNALLRGSFFVTNGPSIDVNFKNSKLNIYTDQSSQITFMGGTKAGKTIELEVVKNVVMASYTFSDDLVWLRAEVKNAKGLAYTQAIQLKQS